MQLSMNIVLRNDLMCFIRKAFTYVEGEKLSHCPYLEYLAHQLEKVNDGEIKRLMINVPPRHLKSFSAAICFSAWTLGHRPELKIAIVTSSQKLSEEITFAIRKIMRSAWYQKVFTSQLSPTRQKVYDFRTTRGGGVRAASLDGGLVGWGANLIILDDSIDLKDGNNAKRIAHVSELFPKLLSRLNNRKRDQVIVIGHRLAENDFYAELAAKRNWTVIVLPLIAPKRTSFEFGNQVWIRKKGEFLHPDSFGEQELREVKEGEFEYFYQQGVGLSSPRIEPKHFRKGDYNVPPGTPIVLSVDPGLIEGSNNSFSCIQAWMRLGSVHVLVDLWREQCGFQGLRRAYLRLQKHYQPVVVLVEATANGPALADIIKATQSRRVILVRPNGRSKLERLRPHIPGIRARNVQLAANLPASDFIDEFVNFATAKFSDQVDALSQYLDWAAENPCPEPPPARGLVVGSVDPQSPGAWMVTARSVLAPPIRHGICLPVSPMPPDRFPVLKWPAASETA